MPRFIESCVVGMNEWSNRPTRFAEPMDRISHVSITVQLWPFWLWIVIICSTLKWSSHCWIVIR